MTHSGGDLLWKICSRCHGLVVIFQIWWLVVVEYGCTWESGCRSIFCTNNLKVNSSPLDPWSQNTEYKNTSITCNGSFATFTPTWCFDWCFCLYEYHIGFLMRQNRTSKIFVRFCSSQVSAHVWWDSIFCMILQLSAAA